MNDDDGEDDKAKNKKGNNNNVVVMSEAGKPIFARHGTEAEISRQCGLFQAIRTAVNGINTSLKLGEIQSLHSNKLCIVFMTVGSITLLSINQNNSASASDSDSEETTTEVFARLQLEYIYAQLIFTLTEQVQNIFIHNPGFDLRTMLTSSDSLMHGILDDIDTTASTTTTTTTTDGSRNVGQYLVSGVQSVFPISHKIRDKTSRVLQSVGGKIDNTAFALLIVGNKLLSLVQPSYRPHQIRVSDLHLILNFVGKQPNVFSHQVELWIPMCLPRFNSTGFLYAYTNCFDPTSKLTLILISSHNTTEQFQLFRDAASKIRQSLHIPAQTDSIITVHSSTNTTATTSSSSSSSSNNNNINHDNGIDSSRSNPHPYHSYHHHNHDVHWTRSESFDEDDDYVNILSENDLLQNRQNNKNNTSSTSITSLLREVRDSIQLSSTYEWISKEYLGDVGSDDKYVDDSTDGTNTSSTSLIRHFLFRADIPVKNCSKQKYPKAARGHLTQCICPPITSSSSSHHSRLWYNYQKLNLRLRLGSASVESSMDAFDMISQDDDEKNNNGSGPTHISGGTGGGGFPGIAQHCPGMGLLESPPNLHGVAYIVEDNEVYLAMNGRDFELYMVAPNSIPVKKLGAVGTKLVRRLMADEKRLFLSPIYTWKE